MEHGPIIWERRQTVRLLEGGIRFFLAAALTASQTAGGYAPFALGLVAAAGPGFSGGMALAGAAAGAMLFLDFAQALSLIHILSQQAKDLLGVVHTQFGVQNAGGDAVRLGHK